MSFILVNDDSPVCEEFLCKYFVDICDRTAHRVRFIFFSALGRQGIFQVGMDFFEDGRRALHRLLTGGRGGDSRERALGDLRPKALEPVTDPRRIFGLLEKAVPAGVRESHRFAQELGIGRYVPCIIIHPDLGGDGIDLLPIGRMSADELFEVLRTIIADHYEANSRAFRDWSEVESRIHRLIQESGIAVASLEGLGSLNARRAFEDLPELSRLYHVLSQPHVGLPERGPSCSFLKASSRFRSAWKRLQARQQCGAWAERLREEVDRLRFWKHPTLGRRALGKLQSLTEQLFTGDTQRLKLARVTLGNWLSLVREFEKSGGSSLSLEVSDPATRALEELAEVLEEVGSTFPEDLRLQALTEVVEGRAEALAVIRRHLGPEWPDRGLGLDLDLEEVEGLFRRLGQYRDARRSVRLPHREHPLVVHVGGGGLRGTSLAGSARDTEPAYVRNLRGRLEKVAAGSAETPAARMARIIEYVLPLEKVETFLVPGAVGPLGRRIQESLSEPGIREALSRLEPQDLEAILEGLGAPSTGAGLEDLVAEVICRVGGDQRPQLFGHHAFRERLEKAREVLLAPRTALNEDPDRLYSAGTSLRRAAERYLKQFLLVYGRLALGQDQLAWLPQACLGDLCSWTLQVVRRAPSVGGDDSKNSPLADRIRDALARPGWHQALKKALDPVPSLTNAFAHDKLHDGEVAGTHRALTVSELLDLLSRLRQSLLALSSQLEEADLYPRCLRFKAYHHDAMHGCRFEFDSDPPSRRPVVVVFSHFPPSIPECGPDTLSVLTRQVMLMVPLNNPEHVDPVLVPL